MHSKERGQVSLFSPSPAHEVEHNELLDKFFALAPERRRKYFVDTTEAARLCGRAPRTIRYWFEMGLIRAVRIGMRDLMVEVASLSKFIHAQAGNSEEAEFAPESGRFEASGEQRRNG